LKNSAKAAALVYFWPIMAKRAAEVSEGTCWRIPLDAKKSELKLFACDLEPLEIPDHILDKARQRKFSV
jgi:hypothetical protein